jgi:CO dehydrogenase/acetyl-CoA synthase beta subunit
MEDVEDEDDIPANVAPRNPKRVLERSDGSDDDDVVIGTPATDDGPPLVDPGEDSEAEEEEEEEEEEKEESAEAELGQFCNDKVSMQLKQLCRTAFQRLELAYLRVFQAYSNHRIYKGPSCSCF